MSIALRNLVSASGQSKLGKSLVPVLVAATVTDGVPLALAAQAGANPDPRVEYVYDVVARRHYGFPNGDAPAEGDGICDKVRRGEGYGQVMGEVKSEVTPSD
jgi:hypothetical protein